MSLYGRTDSNTNKTKAGRARGNGAGSATETIVFVDNTEAGLSENKQRGITSPGWWAYRTYTDAAGNTRHKAELLTFITGPDTNANETQTDDTIAADLASAITIGTQPANQNTSGGAATFSVTASATTGSLVYQWQRKTSSTARWTNISGETSASLALTGLTAAADGYQYRVKLTSSAGAEEVISDTATLTFVD
jgi:hypothetical protein